MSEERPAPRTLAVEGDPKVARDLMTTQIITLSPDDKLEKLEEHMATFSIRHLPVVVGKKVVGLITHRDMLHASSSFLSERAGERDAVIHSLPAQKVMRTELITVGPDEPLAEVARMMWDGKLGCLLVVENDDELLGIITEADFVRLSHHFLNR